MGSQVFTQCGGQNRAYKLPCSSETEHQRSCIVRNNGYTSSEINCAHSRVHSGISSHPFSRHQSDQTTIQYTPAIYGLLHFLIRSHGTDEYEPDVDVQWRPQGAALIQAISKLKVLCRQEIGTNEEEHVWMCAIHSVLYRLWS